MSVGHSFEEVYGAHCRRAQWRIGVQSFATALATIGVSASAIFGLSRLFGAPADASLLRWTWLGALFTSLIFAAWRFHRALRQRRAMARSFDLALDAKGLALAASALLEGHQETRLRPLILRNATEFVTTHPTPQASPLPTKALGFGILAAVVSFWLLGLPRGGLVQKALSDDAGLQSDRAERSRVSDPPTNDSALSGPELQNLARLEIITNQKVYLLGEEIYLSLALVPLADVDSERPLDFVLAATDGSMSKDLGVGSGFRLRPLTLGWALTPGHREPTKILLPIKSELEAAGIYGAGLLTLRVYARLATGGGVAIESNQITIQVAENRERQKTISRGPTAVSKIPEGSKPTNKPKEDPKRGRGGSKPPEQGQDKRLEEAKRIAQAVKPLLSDGPTVEKEVEVFDREEGGAARPASEGATFRDPPTRNFLRMLEDSMQSKTLTPEDRLTLRSYFEALRRRG